MPRTSIPQATLASASAARIDGVSGEGNQIPLGFMSNTVAIDTDAARGAGRNQSIWSGSTFSLFAVLILILGTAALVFATSDSGAPVILTLLSLLAALGIFFVFGLIAGHIRVAERTTHADLITSAFERVDQGLVITGPDASVWQSNTAAHDLLGLGERDPLRLLEDAFGRDASANAAMFRLSRAVERGLTRSEDVFLPQPGELRPGRWVRVVAKPLVTQGFDTDATGAIVWTLTDITIDKARAEQARSSLENRIGLHDEMAGGLLVVEPDDRISHVNGQLAEWLGFTKRGVGPSQIDRAFDVITQDGLAAIRRASASAGSGVKSVTVDLITADGIIWPATAFVKSADTAATTGLDPDAPHKVVALVVPRHVAGQLNAITDGLAVSAGTQSASKIGRAHV